MDEEQAALAAYNAFAYERHLDELRRLTVGKRRVSARRVELVAARLAATERQWLNPIAVVLRRAGGITGSLTGAGLARRHFPGWWLDTDDVDAWPALEGT